MKISLASVFLCLACTAAPAMFAAEKVGFINVDGAIGPATASYISRSIEEAKAQNVQCLVIQVNTPGGLLDSTQKIVQNFLGSPVPVVVYVAPTGATATSAGCFITLAAMSRQWRRPLRSARRIRFPSAVFRAVAKKSQTKP